MPSQIVPRLLPVSIGNGQMRLLPVRRDRSRLPVRPPRSAPRRYSFTMSLPLVVGVNEAAFFAVVSMVFSHMATWGCRFVSLVVGDAGVAVITIDGQVPIDQLGHVGLS